MTTAISPVLGKVTPRIDGFERVAGRARYVADWKVPGMLYGKVILSTTAHAKVKHVNADQARKLPGVESILTFEDTKVQWSQGDRINARFAIADKVRFAGEVVAVVAAHRRDIAERAAEMIDVEYERLPTVFDTKVAMEENAPKIWEGGNLHQLFEAKHGDPEKGLEESHRIFAETYRTGRVHNTPLEPAASLAWWNGDSLTLIAGTQGITTCRQSAAKDLGLPMSKVRVIAYYKGGGFGNKNQDMNHDLLAALLAKKTGKPVMLEYGRRDDFSNIHGRWSTEQQLTMGVDEQGRLTVFSQKVYCNVGAYARHPTRYTEDALAYYACPNLKSEIYAIYTNTPATGNMRGPGGVPSCFASETLMDEISHELKIDPVEFRLKNRTVKHFGKETYTSYGLEDCIRTGAERIKWSDKWHKPGDGPIVDGFKKHGIGVAMCDWHALLGQGAATIRINQDGTAHVAVGVTDIGTGAKSTMALIAADALGFPIQDIQVVWGDTDVCPFSIGESGSRTTTFTGTAVRAAAEDAKRQLLELASKKLEVTSDALELKDKTIYVKSDPQRNLPLSKVAESRPDAIIGNGATHPKLEHGFGRSAFATHYAEVLVDMETGLVEIDRYIAVHDSGPIVNRLTAESQVQGGVIMGLGGALREELIIDPDQGLTTNGDLWTYRVPTHLNAPKIESIFIETDDPFGPKSLGEASIVPVAPAIGNAIFNATGVRLRATPMTPERVLAALD